MAHHIGRQLLVTVLARTAQTGQERWYGGGIGARKQTFAAYTSRGFDHSINDDTCGDRNAGLPYMKSKQLVIWFSCVSAVLVVVGVIFAFFGLAILPVDRENFVPWQSAIYGAIMMGWGTTLLCVGRVAFRRNDSELMKALIYGLIVWLVVEAAFSVHFKVWFNVGVDLVVLSLFSIPLLKAIRSARSAPSSSA